jgi:hypothetical protein
MDMQTLTPLTLAFELAAQGLSHTKIATHLGRHRETIGLWLKGIKRRAVFLPAARGRRVTGLQPEGGPECKGAVAQHARA